MPHLTSRGSVDESRAGPERQRSLDKADDGPGIYEERAPVFHRDILPQRERLPRRRHAHVLAEGALPRATLHHHSHILADEA